MTNLENYGVQEMNAKEIRETDGGFVIEALVSAVVTGIVVATAANFADGLTQGIWDGLSKNRAAKYF